MIQTERRYLIATYCFSCLVSTASSALHCNAL
jgi:hypothetical protein